MESIKIQFLNELSDLKHLTTYYDLESNLLLDYQMIDDSPEIEYLIQLSDKLKQFSLSKKLYNYNSIIISLYGSFERFIENCLVTYIENINHIVLKYDKLPDTILKNHLFLSLSLLNKIEHPKYTGPLKKQDIIRNLHTCININEEYQLNKDAFAQHTANFRLQVIDECFSHVGISNISQRLLIETNFRDYIIKIWGLNNDAKLLIDASFQLLNELAERRNDVAHGVPSEILQNSILFEYIEFFENYSLSLVDILNKELLCREIEEFGIRLGKITDIYSAGEVICLYTDNNQINIGDIIIGKHKNEIIKAKIIEIELDGKKIKSVDNKANYEIGIKIDLKFKKNFKVFLFKNDMH